MEGNFYSHVIKMDVPEEEQKNGLDLFIKVPMTRFNAMPIEIPINEYFMDFDNIDVEIKILLIEEKDRSKQKKFVFKGKFSEKEEVMYLDEKPIGFS